MKTKILLFCFIAALFVACNPIEDKNDLGTLLTKADLKFETPFGEDNNTVILKNLTPNTIPVWDYGTGKSQRQTDTIHFPFKGDYTIKFSVICNGGYVKADSVIIHILQNNFKYVNDPLWTALTGGVGEEKVWYLDLNDKGECKYFTTPVGFAGLDESWTSWTMRFIDKDSEEKIKSATGLKDIWAYLPEWKGTEWFNKDVPKGDYGSITFSLKGGATVTANHLMIPSRGTENGTFYLDATNKKLTLNGVAPLHDAFRDKQTVSWGNAKILSLTEDHMQLGIVRDNKPDENPCLLVYNFISKKYSDSWVAPVTADPNFNFGDQKQLLSVSTTKVWKLDTNVPYNWTDVNGAFLNNWTKRADYAATGWAPYTDADIANIDGASISFASDGVVVVTKDDGTSTTGSYTLDEATNMITFKGLTTPFFSIAGWASVETTSKLQWKIVKVEKNASDKVVGIWFGKKDPSKSEYMVYHFVLASKK